jgi:hypothetical protein
MTDYPHTYRHCPLKARIDESRQVLIDGWLKAYEMATGDVSSYPCSDIRIYMLSRSTS